MASARNTIRDLDSEGRRSEEGDAGMVDPKDKEAEGNLIFNPEKTNICLYFIVKKKKRTDL
jgi:hypothetical protein